MVKERCKVIYKNGALLLTDVNDNPLPYQQSLVLENDCTNIKDEAFATVRLVVDLSKLKKND